MRRRLGCGGTPRLRIRELVWRDARDVAGAERIPLGLTAPQLDTFWAAGHLPRLAEAFGSRGDAERLRLIAWWGSALADVALDRGAARRDAVLAESAAFNLAVALFDTTCEEQRAAAPILVHALAPARMTARLFAPDDERCRITCGDHTLDLVASLFDAVFASAGRRLATSPRQLSALAAQLERMYLSELRRTDDPFVAKTGPVTFIGSLVDGTDASRVRPLYAALGRLCQEWDDWNDLAEDFARMEPNSFVGVPGGPFALGTIAFGFRGAARLVAGPAMHAGIARSLSARLRDVIASGRACGEDTHRRSLAFCRELLS